jgi:thiol-disulfide isomerase/thioredoxin
MAGIKHPGSCTRRVALASVAGLAGTLLPAAAQQAALAPAPASAPEPAVPLPAIGSRLPLPDVPLLDGSRFRAADADGQVLVLYWWASWCPFCAQQTPVMDSFWRSHASQGLRMLGLSIDRKPDDASAYLRRKGYGFPSGWVTPEVARVLPKPKGLPVTLVRGRDGRVLAAEAGQLFPEDVEQFARFLKA